jgi:AraC-like DNA-binding protein
MTAMSKNGNMQDSSAGRGTHFPTANGGISRLAYEKLVQAGVPVEPLLRQAGMSLEVIQDHAVRLRVRDQIAFLNLAARALKDEFLGFNLALHTDLREIGLLYYVLASSENLNDALKRGARYSGLVNEGIVGELIPGKHDKVAVRYLGVSRHPDRHQIEFWMTALVRVCRKLSGRKIIPRSVRFVHMRKQSNSRFSAIFGDDIKFGTAVDEVVFSGNLEQIPVLGADPHLNKLLVKYCDEALARRPRNVRSFQSSVQNAIVPLLPHGKAVVGEIAPRLGVSRRTLARRLSVEGLSFTGVLEDLKLHLARRYLADRELPISEIAWLLGYQEIGAFSRAFKRWTGKSPRDARSTIAT